MHNCDPSLYFNFLFNIWLIQWTCANLFNTQRTFGTLIFYNYKLWGTTVIMFQVLSVCPFVSRYLYCNIEILWPCNMNTLVYANIINSYILCYCPSSVKVIYLNRQCIWCHGWGQKHLSTPSPRTTSIICHQICQKSEFNLQHQNLLNWTHCNFLMLISSNTLKCKFECHKSVSV